MRIHNNGRELEIKVDDTVLMHWEEESGYQRSCKEGWKSWKKVQVDGTVYKGDIHAHSLGRSLIINKDYYIGPNGPHPRKYLSDNTVAKFVYNTTHRSANPIPSHIRLWFASLPLHI